MYLNSIFATGNRARVPRLDFPLKFYILCASFAKNDFCVILGGRRTLFVGIIAIRNGKGSWVVCQKGTMARHKCSMPPRASKRLECQKVLRFSLFWFSNKSGDWIYKTVHCTSKLTDISCYNIFIFFDHYLHSVNHKRKLQQTVAVPSDIFIVCFIYIVANFIYSFCTASFLKALKFFYIKKGLISVSKENEMNKG